MCAPLQRRKKISKKLHVVVIEAIKKNGGKKTNKFRPVFQRLSEMTNNIKDRHGEVTAMEL